MRVLLSLLLLLAGGALAVQRPVPAPLAPWVDWVRSPEATCPWRSGPDKGRLCQWYGALHLRPDGDGLAFDFSVLLRRPGWVPLPGSRAAWPTAVQVDGGPAAVIARDGRPWLWLEQAGPAARRVTGRLPAGALRRGLAVPDGMAIIDYRADGQPRPLYRDDRGRWRLRPLPDSGAAPAPPAPDRLDLRVFRLLDDAIPARVVTRIELDVAGRVREVALPGAALPGTEAIALQGDLPAATDPAGHLRVILRPGRHVLRLTAIAPALVTAWRRPEAEAPWPRDEFWAVRRHPDLHAAELSGGHPVDAALVHAPPEWARLPLYRLGPGEALTVRHVTRGTRGGDRGTVRVQRDLWITLDGARLVGRDRLQGRLGVDPLLLVPRDLGLAGATLDGRPQPLLAVDAAHLGLRPPHPALDATLVWRRSAGDGLGLHRLELPLMPYRAGRGSLQAEGLTTTLHLPPGWQLLAAQGVRGAAGWLGSWTLFELFLVIVTALLVRRAVGNGAALLTALTLTLGHALPFAPGPDLWLFVLAVWLLAAALRRRAAAGSGRGTAAALARYLAGLLGLVLAAQVLWGSYSAFRLASYPQLGWRLAAAPPPPPARLLRKAERKALDRSAAPALHEEAAPLAAAPPAEPPQPIRLRDDNLLRAVGPAVPRWRGTTWTLTWTAADLGARPTARLYLLGPLGQRLWHALAGLLMPLLLAVLAWRLGGGLGDRPPPRPPGPLGRLLAGALLLALAGTTQAADFPPPALLQELAQTVNAPPECLPDCAGIEAVAVRVGPLPGCPLGGVTLDYRLRAATETAVPLAQGDLQWRDGPPLRREGSRLLAVVPAGAGALRLQGCLTARDGRLDWPLPAARVSWRAERPWRVEPVYGKAPDGRPDERPVRALRLLYRPPGTAAEGTPPPPRPASEFAPWFRVTRTLVMDREWRLHTRVERLSASGAHQLVLPAWGDEAPLDERVRLVDGRYRLDFPAGQSVLAWQSRLTPVDHLDIPPAGARQETRWVFRHTPLWRLRSEGLPFTWRGGHPELLPWPGEGTRLEVTRFRAAPAPTLAVTALDLTLRPQHDAAGEASLVLHTRASMAHRLHIDHPGLAVRAATVDGQPANVPLDGDRLTLPLAVGEQRIELTLALPPVTGFPYRSPDLRLASEAGSLVPANVDLRVQLPAGRWVLDARADRGVGVVSLLPLLAGMVGGFLLLLWRLRLRRPIGLASWALILVGVVSAAPGSPLVGGALFSVYLAWAALLARPGGGRAYRIALAALSLAVLLATLVIVANSLIGHPHDQYLSLAGGGLHWYQDYGLPRVRVFSLDLWWFRVLALAWAVWLATALIGWLRTAWLRLTEPPA